MENIYEYTKRENDLLLLLRINTPAWNSMRNETCLSTTVIIFLFDSVDRNENRRLEIEEREYTVRHMAFYRCSNEKRFNCFKLDERITTRFVFPLFNPSAPVNPD